MSLQFCSLLCVPSLVLACRYGKRDRGSCGKSAARTVVLTVKEKHETSTGCVIDANKMDPMSHFFFAFSSTVHDLRQWLKLTKNNLPEPVISILYARGRTFIALQLQAL